MRRGERVGVRGAARRHGQPGGTDRRRTFPSVVRPGPGCARPLGGQPDDVTARARDPGTSRRRGAEAARERCRDRRSVNGARPCRPAHRCLRAAHATRCPRAASKRRGARARPGRSGRRAIGFDGRWVGRSGARVAGSRPKSVPLSPCRLGSLGGMAAGGEGRGEGGSALLGGVTADRADVRDRGPGRVGVREDCATRGRRSRPRPGRRCRSSPRRERSA
jgi:hypothetical protein